MFEKNSGPASSGDNTQSSQAAAAASQSSPKQSFAFEPIDTYETVLNQLYRWNIRAKEIIISQGGMPTKKTSLENMALIAQAFGNPQDSYKIVHVAGTNGKGSVCLKTAAAL